MSVAKLQREVRRTGDEYLAALEALARWEEANPWPDTDHGITEKHWQWRREKDAFDAECGFSRKARLNMDAYRRLRSAAAT